MTNGFAWKFIFLSIVEAERTTRKKNGFAVFTQSVKRYERASKDHDSH